MDLPELQRSFVEAAVHHDAMASEMTRLTQEGCGPGFSAALSAVARNHRIRAIALRSRAASLEASADG